MADEKVFQLYTRPGIKRDGTNFDSDEYTEGIWTRFNRGRPRKVRGYFEVTPNAKGICRGAFLNSDNGRNNIIYGYNNGIQNVLQQKIVGGAGITEYRLPSQFQANDLNIWTFDGVVDVSGDGKPLQLLAHASPKLYNIDDDTNTNVFYGTIGDTQTTMKVLTDVTVSAGANVLGTPTPTTNTYSVAGNPFSLTQGAPTQVVVAAVATGAETIDRLSPYAPATATYNGTNTSFVSTQVFLFVPARIAIRTSTPIQVSGGVVQLHPFTFVYGRNGLIKNNDPTVLDIPLEAWTGGLANETNAGSSNVVAALPIRGGSQSPSGLFWTLDSLIRVSFTGGTGSGGAFRYDTVSGDTTIISSKTPVEVDGIYYWIGTDRFYTYNGVVQELPNDKNINYFFDGLTYEYRQKIWGLPIKRWGEIWWFYPRDGSTECNDVLVYNYREKLWYDLGKADGCNRSTGVSSRIFEFPIMMDNRQGTVWQHETGQDEVTSQGVFPIRAYIETSDFSWAAGGPAGRSPVSDPYSTRINRIEPDFNLKGKLKITVRGRKYAQSTDFISSEYIITSDTEKIDMREQRRLIRLGIESNDLGGDFEFGRILIHAEPGDIRPAGG